MCLISIIKPRLKNRVLDALSRKLPKDTGGFVVTLLFFGGFWLPHMEYNGKETKLKWNGTLRNKTLRHGKKCLSIIQWSRAYNGTTVQGEEYHYSLLDGHPGDFETNQRLTSE